MAIAKVQGLTMPRDYSEIDLTALANQSKVGKVSYEEAIAEIDNDPTVQNKDLAKQVFAKIYGKKVEKPVYGIGNFKDISLDDRIKQLQDFNTKNGFGKNLGVKEDLIKAGYPIDAIKNSTANAGEKFLDSISKFLFKK